MTDETDQSIEYRISGKTAGEWRATAWGDRETAVEDYESASGNWGLIALERRQRGDDSTLERSPNPDSNNWTQVTQDMTHIKGEEVAPNGA